MPFFILAVIFLRSVFKSRRQLLLENLALRQQVTMLRKSVKRPRATVADKLFWILFSRYVDGWRRLISLRFPLPDFGCFMYSSCSARIVGKLYILM
jgi:hypothetical protein